MRRIDTIRVLAAAAFVAFLVEYLTCPHRVAAVLHVLHVLGIFPAAAGG